jgi:hypothetical protein
MDKAFGISELSRFKEKAVVPDIDEFDFTLKPTNPRFAKAKYIVALKKAVRSSRSQIPAHPTAEIPKAIARGIQLSVLCSKGTLAEGGQKPKAPLTYTLSGKLVRNAPCSKLEKFYVFPKDRMRVNSKSCLRANSAFSPKATGKPAAASWNLPYDELVRKHHSLVDKEFLRKGLDPFDRTQLQWIEAQLEAYEREDLRRLQQNEKEAETKELQELRELSAKIDSLLKARK